MKKIIFRTLMNHAQENKGLSYGLRTGMTVAQLADALPKHDTQEFYQALYEMLDTPFIARENRFANDIDTVYITNGGWIHMGINPCPHLIAK